MKNIRLITKRTAWVSMMAIFVAGTFLWADGGLLSKQELKTLISTAKTAQDHQRLAKHFSAKADELEAESTEHQAMAVQYKANPSGHEMKHPNSAQTASHCKFLADDLHKASQRARRMATDHQEMAKQSK